MESNISKKEYEDFSSLFLEAPSLSLLHISNNCTLVNSCLEDIKLKNDGTIINKNFNDINCDKFRLKTREYEFIIISDLFNDCTNKQRFFKSCYHSLENGAYIIIIEHKSKNNVQEILELLDEVEYRVANSINIFENYNLIMAKKLHMWGNGL